MIALGADKLQKAPIEETTVSMKNKRKSAKPCHCAPLSIQNFS